MWQVEIHTFNEAGHFHTQKFFEENKRGKELVPYVHGEIEKLLKDGFVADDFRCRTEQNGKAKTIYTFCKEEQYVTDWVDIHIRQIEPNVEYEYEC